MSSPQQIEHKPLERLKQFYHEHINLLLEPIISYLSGQNDPKQLAKSLDKILFSACFTFIFGVIIGAFQLYGVINATLAHFLIFLCWLFAVLAIWGLLPSEPRDKVNRLLLKSALSLAFIFAGIDLLMIYLKPTPEFPDITLQLFDPESPTLLVKNPSRVLAKDIKYQIGIFNVDLPLEPTAFRHPLPILVQEINWIKSNDEIGPTDVFNTQLVSPLLKKGNRLVGTIAVNCAECLRGRTYFVYINWGKDGWYSEIKDEQSGRNRGPSVLREGILEAYLNFVESKVPQADRIPIHQR